MYCIGDAQIEYILNDIRRNGIETEDLQLNLLDHICCMIEQNLEENGDFEDFYKTNIRKFYKSELREIEEETANLLTFKNYYKMKKTMIVCGAISAAAFVFGSFLKAMHLPGAAVMLFGGMILFSLFFLPLLVILKIKEISATRDKVILLLGAAIGILFFMSMLWLLNNWPMKHELWLFTLALASFVFLPVYFFTGIRNADTRINTIVSSIILVAVLGMQFTLTQLHHPGEQIPPSNTALPAHP